MTLYRKLNLSIYDPNIYVFLYTQKKNRRVSGVRNSLSVIIAFSEKYGFCEHNNFKLKRFSDLYLKHVCGNTVKFSFRHTLVSIA